MKKAILTSFMLALLLPAVAFGKEEAVPSIDGEAASIVKNEKGEIVEEKGTDSKMVAAKSPYSLNFWTFLFAAYLFLLVFNLSFDFGKEKSLHWFWESLFTFLAIFAWDNLDAGRANEWFPAVVMESGIIIYAFYFYFHRRISRFL